MNKFNVTKVVIAFSELTVKAGAVTALLCPRALLRAHTWICCREILNATRAGTFVRINGKS